MGYTSDEFKTLSIERLVSVEEWKESKRCYVDTLKGFRRSFEVMVTHKDESQVALNILTIPVYVDNAIEGVYGIAKDITEQKNALAKVNYMAYHDELTGLPNRRSFKQKADILIQQHSEEMSALLLMDIDRFKSINDTLGHTQGDLFIKEIAKRFTAWLQPGEILAKIGEIGRAHV